MLDYFLSFFSYDCFGTYSDVLLENIHEKMFWYQNDEKIWAAIMTTLVRRKIMTTLVRRKENNDQAL